MIEQDEILYSPPAAHQLATRIRFIRQNPSNGRATVKFSDGGWRMSSSLKDLLKSLKLKEAELQTWTKQEWKDIQND